MAALEKNNIQSVLIPATCTDRLQPLDISVNKSAKVFVRSEFQQWYAAQISNRQDNEDDGRFKPVEMSAPRMKCVGAQWLVRLHEHFLDSPDIIIKESLSSGIPQSILTTASLTWMKVTRVQMNTVQKTIQNKLTPQK